MAFVHRKIYKQKPKQWGPFPAVQAGLFHNAERLGIDPASIALAIPIWNPGEQRDYSKNSFAIIQPISSPPAYEQNRLIFTGGVSRAPAIGHSSTSPNALTFTSEDDFTLMARGNLSNAGNGTYLLAQSDVLYLQKRSNNGTLRFQVPSGNYNYTDTMFPDEMANITGTYTANDLKLYLNSICLHTNNSTSTWSAQGYEWAFGSHQYNVENIPDGVSIYESIYIFSIVLSRRQIASLSDNPWQLWQPVPTVYYSFSAAPVTSNDQVYLIPGTGLYKDTEQDSVKLIPGGGLYKEQEGVSGSTLLPNTLTVSVAGLDATITTGTVISASKGSVSISGATADISAGTTIQATSGSVVVDGANPDVSAGNSIAVTTGTITVTGIDATITNSATILATSGVVVVSGKQASISAGATISSVSGAISITGLPANVLNENTIAATTGAVSIQGLDADVSAGTSIAVTTGTIQATGLNATVGTETSIISTIGTVLVSGFQADIEKTFLIDAITGSVIITGLGVSIQSGTGQDTPAERKYIINIENRIYTINTEERIYTI